MYYRENDIPCMHAPAFSNAKYKFFEKQILASVISLLNIRSLNHSNLSIRSLLTAVTNGYLIKKAFTPNDQSYQVLLIVV